MQEIPQEFLAMPGAADVACSCMAGFWPTLSGGSKETMAVGDQEGMKCRNERSKTDFIFMNLKCISPPFPDILLIFF